MMGELVCDEMARGALTRAMQAHPSPKTGEPPVALESTSPMAGRTHVIAGCNTLIPRRPRNFAPSSTALSMGTKCECLFLLPLLSLTLSRHVTPRFLSAQARPRTAAPDNSRFAARPLLPTHRFRRRLTRSVPNFLGFHFPADIGHFCGYL